MANNAQTIRHLIKRRGVIKAQITSFNKFLAEFRNGQTINAIRITQRMQKFKETSADLDKICDELDAIDEDTDHVPERIAIQEQCLDLISEAECLLATATSHQPTECNGTSNNTQSEEGNGTSNRIPRLKLPEAALPKFDGKHEQWFSFKDAFLAMIGNRNEISNVEKLQYLKASLVGDAARKIGIFTITNDNYPRAWELLEQSYQDERIIISRHLSLLLRIPMQEKETAAGLTRLADEMQQHLLSLRSLGVDVGHHIIVQLVVEKLHKSTRQKWDESLERGVFPELSKLTEFLYRTASRIAQWDLEGREGSTNHTANKSAKTTKTARTFATMTNNKCAVCSESAHPLYKCERFCNLPVQKRIKIVEDASLCLNCLRSHGTKECKFRNCLRCNERHNTLLHQESESANSKSQN